MFLEWNIVNFTLYKFYSGIMNNRIPLDTMHTISNVSAGKGNFDIKCKQVGYVNFLYLLANV